jgi:hypothetical protein
MHRKRRRSATCESQSQTGIGTTSMKQNTEGATFKLVRDRLEHVELIFGLRHHFHGEEHVKMIGDSGWTHSWLYFDALMNYLLLTCFDLLGQPSGWVSFPEWLTSSKKAEERSKAAASVPPGADPIQIAQHVHTEYQALYGVKTSFNHFVLNLLTAEERAELFSSIGIIRGRMDGDPNTAYPALGEISDEKKKLDFLFSLRNKFTHSAITMGSPAAGLFRDIYEAHMIDGVPKKGYIEIHRESKNGEWLIYQVRDWPFVLQRSIAAVLARRESQASV